MSTATSKSRVVRVVAVGTEDTAGIDGVIVQAQDVQVGDYLPSDGATVAGWGVRLRCPLHPERFECVRLHADWANGDARRCFHPTDEIWVENTVDVIDVPDGFTPRSLLGKAYEDVDGYEGDRTGLRSPARVLVAHGEHVARLAVEYLRSWRVDAEEQGYMLERGDWSIVEPVVDVAHGVGVVVYFDDDLGCMFNGWACSVQNAATVMEYGEAHGFIVEAQSDNSLVLSPQGS